MDFPQRELGAVSRERGADGGPAKPANTHFTVALEGEKRRVPVFLERGAGSGSYSDVLGPVFPSSWDDQGSWLRRAPFCISWEGVVSPPANPCKVTEVQVQGLADA